MSLQVFLTMFWTVFIGSKLSISTYELCLQILTLRPKNLFATDPDTLGTRLVYSFSAGKWNKWHNNKNYSDIDK